MQSPAAETARNFHSPLDILLLKAGVPEKEAAAAAPRAVAKNTSRQNGNRIEAGSYTLRFDPATALPEAILSADGGSSSAQPIS